VKLKYIRLLGIVIFVIVLFKVDLGEIFNFFKSIQPIDFILSIIILFIFHISKSMRWQYILARQSINYKLLNCYLMYSAGLYAGVVTPGRLGDFIKALYLKKDGHSAGKALASVFLDRILDLFFLFLIAIPSFVWIRNSSNKNINIFGILVIIALIIIVLMLLASKRSANFFGKIFLRFIPSKYKSLFRNNFSDFYSNLKLFSFSNYLIIVLFTIFGWLIYFYLIFFLCKAANLNMPFYQVVFFNIVSFIIAFLPISIAGIGTRDVTLIYFFTQMDYSKEAAILFSLIVLLMYFLTALLGLSAWLIKPIKW